MTEAMFDRVFDSQGFVEVHQIRERKQGYRSWRHLAVAEGVRSRFQITGPFGQSNMAGNFHVSMEVSSWENHP